VILSHEREFIYIKTRKTASTSVEIALSRYVGERGVITTIDPVDEAIRAGLGLRGPQNEGIPLRLYTLRHWVRRLRRKEWARYYIHMPAYEVRETLRRSTWQSYYRFCLERNPWDKAMSLYYWRTQHVRPRPPLLTFLRSLRREELSNWETYTIDGRLAVDRVYRYEALESELAHLRQTLGLPADLQLPHAKSQSCTDHRPYPAIMGREERSLVARACAREIALLGYTFD
jgi:hypothetical protein